MTFKLFALKLKHPTEATLLMGVKKYEQVAIRVDESEKFKQLLKDTLQNQVQWACLVKGFHKLIKWGVERHSLKKDHQGAAP